MAVLRQCPPLLLLVARSLTIRRSTPFSLSFQHRRRSSFFLSLCVSLLSIESSPAEVPLCPLLSHPIASPLPPSAPVFHLLQPTLRSPASTSLVHRVPAARTSSQLSEPHCSTASSSLSDAFHVLLSGVDFRRVSQAGRQAGSLVVCRGGNGRPLVVCLLVPDVESSRHARTRNMHSP